MTHPKRLLTMTVALGAATLLMTAGAALAAKHAPQRQTARSMHRQLLAYRQDLIRQRNRIYREDRAYRRDLAYGRFAPGGYGQQVPLDYRDAYPVGAYGTVDELYGYPPGGIVARRTIENQMSPGLSSELDYTTKQTATGGPVGGPLFGGSGR